MIGEKQQVRSTGSGQGREGGIRVLATPSDNYIISVSVLCTVDIKFSFSIFKLPFVSLAKAKASYWKTLELVVGLTLLGF